MKKQGQKRRITRSSTDFNGPVVLRKSTGKSVRKGGRMECDSFLFHYLRA